MFPDMSIKFLLKISIWTFYDFEVCNYDNKYTTGSDIIMTFTLHIMASDDTHFKIL